MPPPKFNQLVEGIDYYREGGKIVFTATYHLKRGYCCHSRCRHCPYGLAPSPDTYSFKIDPLPQSVPLMIPGARLPKLPGKKE
jgi:hypothetical protein